MASAAQVVSLGLAVALMAAAAYGMYLVFGALGGIMVVVFTVPVIALVTYLSGGDDGGSSGGRRQTRRSKGAQDRGE
ncbi:hypothetical protein EGH24_13790 [Halonotius terrestris]|uniref:Uncharacterized protein n=1 Tax=Halonotius terrestris TaxID=2487750 RepID=A0A8J8P9K5_9EURY|nr:hypothetical protein [Halonotius terrestris]TQQ78589.1 hypothetical protein EGH24_13790 [Halonotius terrestris]